LLYFVQVVFMGHMLYRDKESWCLCAFCAPLQLTVTIKQKDLKYFYDF
jgi:hypothetical protein